jgi:hypothetical protein
MVVDNHELSLTLACNNIGFDTGLIEAKKAYIQFA